MCIRTAYAAVSATSVAFVLSLLIYVTANRNDGMSTSLGEKVSAAITSQAHV